MYVYLCPEATQNPCGRPRKTQTGDKIVHAEKHSHICMLFTREAGPALMSAKRWMSKYYIGLRLKRYHIGRYPQTPIVSPAAIQDQN